jgi:NADPH-dependent 2,4-dienoyl-CoA reductase/sulfur reductase-like enzyme
LQGRGFRPVLFDPSPRLGGTLNIADKGIGKEKITRLVDSMIAQARESGIELRLGEQATVEKVRALEPCGVFVACGARPFLPPVTGVDGKNVVTAEDVLMGRKSVEGECLIVGSGMTGLETAEVVARAGHKITIADMMPQIGAGVMPWVVGDLSQHLQPYEPTYLLGHKLLKITPEGAAFEPAEGGASVLVKADTVILAMGVRPRKDVVDAFKSAFPDARVIGDAALGGRILEATQAAYGQAFVFTP